MKKAIILLTAIGGDPSKWRRNLSTYEFVNLGEVYKGIELKLPMMIDLKARCCPQ